jgi:dCMP deaminase
VTGFPIPDLVEGRLIGRPGWDQYFMAIAKVVSTRSTCSSRPVGCVITRENRILVTGYNGAPPGEPHCTDQGGDGRIYCARRASMVPDELKHQSCRSLHAEENALSLAVKLGLSELLAGAAIYSTLSPCVRCIERLKALGVARVYYELAYESIDAERDRRWEALAKESFEVYERVSLSGPSARKIAGALVGVTSERLLPSG